MADQNQHNTQHAAGYAADHEEFLTHLFRAIKSPPIGELGREQTRCEHSRHEADFRLQFDMAKSHTTESEKPRCTHRGRNADWVLPIHLFMSTELIKFNRNLKESCCIPIS